MNPGSVADAVLVVHAALVVFVVAGLPAIVVGGVRRWRWTRAWPFRALHLAAIAIVAFESWFAIDCPLTTWEARLRVAAGEPVDQRGFVARGVHALLFHDAPPWIFTTAYTLFAIAVVAAWRRWPPTRACLGDRRAGAAP